MSEIKNGREIAVFGGGVTFDVTDDWPPMPELPVGPRWCRCGERLTPEGRCSVGYTKHRQLIERANAA